MANGSQGSAPEGEKTGLPPDGRRKSSRACKRVETSGTKRDFKDSISLNTNDEKGDIRRSKGARRES